MAMTLADDNNSSTRLFQLVAKRVFDIVASAIGLVVLSPLFLLASLAIKLDSGGRVFSVQQQYCYNNQRIQVYKFRCSTRIGPSLVRSGVDRLPMLINVFRGEISLVGPRPYNAPPSLPLADRRSDVLRHTTLKPGLNGWARVPVSQSDNAESELRRQIEDDLFYVRNWSLLFDAKIILMSFFSKASYIPAPTAHADILPPDQNDSPLL
jgi:lipopolysaccharide/colanic/teichoic acid biosynthesis glycosyltransferase